MQDSLRAAVQFAAKRANRTIRLNRGLIKEKNKTNAKDGSAKELRWNTE